MWSKERPTEPGAYLSRCGMPGSLTAAVYIVRGEDGVLRYDDPEDGEEVIDENEPYAAEWCPLVPLPDRDALAGWLLNRYLVTTGGNARDLLADIAQTDADALLAFLNNSTAEEPPR